MAPPRVQRARGGALPPEVAGILSEVENDPGLAELAAGYGIDIDVIQQALSDGFLGSDDEDDDQGGMELPAVPEPPPPPQTTTRDMLITRASVTYRQDGEPIGRADLVNGVVDVYAVRVDSGARSRMDRLFSRHTLYLMSDMQFGMRKPLSRLHVGGNSIQVDRPLVEVGYTADGSKIWPFDEPVRCAISVAVEHASSR